MHLCAVSPEVGTRMAGDASSVTSRVCSGEAFSEQSVLKEAAFSRPEPYSFLLDGRNGASVFSKSFAHATGRRRRERADARRKKSRGGIRAEVSPGRTALLRSGRRCRRRCSGRAEAPLFLSREYLLWRRCRRGAAGKGKKPGRGWTSARLSGHGVFSCRKSGRFSRFVAHQSAQPGGRRKERIGHPLFLKGRPAVVAMPFHASCRPGQGGGRFAAMASGRASPEG